MAALITISLNKVLFHAFHGLYPEEKKSGNDFEINMRLSFEPDSGLITALGDTINYESVFHQLKEEMEKPRDLLETFVMEMAQVLHDRFPQIKYITISIKKMKPPIQDFRGSVEVEYRKDY